MNESLLNSLKKHSENIFIDGNINKGYWSNLSKEENNKFQLIKFNIQSKVETVLLNNTNIVLKLADQNHIFF